MGKIAFIYGDLFVYWHSVILICGVLTAVFLFLAFWLDRGGKMLSGATTVVVSILLSTVLSRFIHWYSMSATYAGFASAMTDYSSGGYALMGVFLGCLITACLLRLVKVHRNLPAMLDCMALAGAAGVAVGRLADLFTSADLGMEVTFATALPIACPVVDALTGQTTYRLATFMIQAIVSALIFIVLLVVYFRRGQGKCFLPEGDLAVWFILTYGAAQAVLDSTRYDSLFFRGNGFVSIVQVLCTVGVVLSIAYFSVRMVRKRGFKWTYIPLWLLAAGLLGGAGYMEYHVQRHGHQAVFAYSMMSLCLAAAVLLTLVIYRLSLRKPRFAA